MLPFVIFVVIRDDFIGFEKYSDKFPQFTKPSRKPMSNILRSMFKGFLFAMDDGGMFKHVWQDDQPVIQCHKGPQKNIGYGSWCP